MQCYRYLKRINVLNQHLTDPLQWIGASGASPGRYERPQGITFDLEGRIIICDTKQKRIQILHPKGRGFEYYMEYSGNKNYFSVSYSGFWGPNMFANRPP